MLLLCVQPKGVMMRDIALPSNFDFSDNFTVTMKKFLDNVDHVVVYQ